MRRQAALVIAIFRASSQGVVLVERAAHFRDHPGQIGLPGGGVHPEDANLKATALRGFTKKWESSRHALSRPNRVPDGRRRKASVDMQENERFAEGEAIRESFDHVCSLASSALAETLERIINRPNLFIPRRPPPLGAFDLAHIFVGSGFICHSKLRPSPSRYRLNRNFLDALGRSGVRG